MLVRHEAMKLKPYRDTQGKLTIGVGRNLDDVGISKEEAERMLDADISRAVGYAGAFSWYRNLNEPRRDVILSMIFNMGPTRFREFKKMHQALMLGRFEIAAAEMLSSVWATQVGSRARELAEMMRTGSYDR